MVMITTRVTEAEKQAIVQACRATGKKPGTVMRMAIYSIAAAPVETRKKIVRELAAMQGENAMALIDQPKFNGMPAPTKGT